MPLAVRWGAKVKGERKVADFVSLCDFAPTFLEAAGLKPGQEMTGRSLMPLLTSDKTGHIDATRDFVLTGLERHVYLNPSRAIRTADFLFIRNFDPGQWPSGEVEGTPEDLRFRCRAVAHGKRSLLVQHRPLAFEAISAIAPRGRRREGIRQA